MIIAGVLLIVMLLVIFSLVLGENFIGAFAQVGVDADSIVDGIPQSFIVDTVDVLYYIDTTVLVNAGITLLITIGITAGITGISVLGSGLNPQSSRIIVILSAYTGLWIALSILAYNLIVGIEIFGFIIYVSLTIAYAIGVIQKLPEG